MTTHRLKISAVDDPECTRTVEFLPEHTLGHVHDVIRRELALEGEHPHAFYLSGEWLDASTQLDPKSPDYQGPLSRLGLIPGMTIAYLFDPAEERWHDVEVLEPGVAQAELKYPHVSDSHGTPLPPDDEVAICPECVAARASFPAHLDGMVGPIIEALYDHPSEVDEEEEEETDDEHDHDDGPDPAISPEWRELALRAAGAALDQATDEHRAAAFTDRFRVPPEDFACCVRDAVGNVDPAAAIPLAGRIAKLNALGENVEDRLAVAALIGGLGQRAEALSWFETEPTRRPQLIEFRLTVAKLLLAFGLPEDVARADHLLGTLLAERWLSGEARTELRGLLETLPASAPSRLQAVAKGVIPRGGPRVGRNDPCPCESGKKYKKCCGVS